MTKRLLKYNCSSNTLSILRLSSQLVKKNSNIHFFQRDILTYHDLNSNAPVNFVSISSYTFSDKNDMDTSWLDQPVRKAGDQ